jgi:hypothetical protein
LCLVFLSACQKKLDVSSPCQAIVTTCTGGTVTARRVKDAPLPFSGPDVLGATDDIVLANDRLVAVIDALDTPHGLAPTGGTLIDLAPFGGFDQLNQVYVAAGILPDDAFHYTSLTVVSEPSLAAVVLHGTLDGRPDLSVATRYELRPCEPFLRARSELHNGSPEPYTFFLADVSFWGNREPLPFSVARGQGFLQPELNLADLDSSWGTFPYVAARATGGPAVAYAFLACDRDALEGLNDPQVSALGTPRTIVRPGETLSLQRVLLATPGPDIESVAALAFDLRQTLHGDKARASVRGRVVAGGKPFGGNETRATVIARAGKTPVSEAIPKDDGTFALSVPASVPVTIEVRSFGRVVATLPGAPDVGDVAVPEPGTLHVTIPDGLPTSIVLQPADEATRTATLGQQNGRFSACAPYLGPPHGASPACNRALLSHELTIEVPTGNYVVFATRGPFHELVETRLSVSAAEIVEWTAAPQRLPDLAPGLLSADLHVHGQASFDSSVPDADRVLSFAAAGVDVIAATDHDVIVSYESTVRALGLEKSVNVMAGLETSGLIPFLDVPGQFFPRVIGHFNFWPVDYAPGQPRAGAPWDELIEPGELFDRMEPLLGPSGLAMLNHPWDEPQSGRDLGYLRAVGYDPRVTIPALDDGTNTGMLARRPLGQHRNLDVQVVEVLNGRSITKYLQYRALWWSLLSQGYVMAGAANSDSHSLNDAQLGYPRNLVPLETFDEEGFNQAVKEGRGSGGYGIVIDATLDGQPFGLAPLVPTAHAELVIEVRAAPWIPVTELRVIVNGKTVNVVPIAGSQERVRFRGTIAVGGLLPAKGDAWLLLEAGLPLPLAADRDDDGIVDTTDNNHDGIVDRRDVEEGEATGPLEDPADPTDPDDPRFRVTSVAPGTWPLAFTNPWRLDATRDGTWEAPGL